MSMAVQYQEPIMAQAPTSSPPHSREAEESVVGSVMINPDVYYECAQFLCADDFYIHRHRWIWEAFTALHEKRAPIDLLTVADELAVRGLLEELGGPSYLTALVSNTPTSLNAEYYAKIVEGHAVRRKLIHSANTIAQLAYDPETSVEDVQELAAKSLYESMQNQKGTGESLGSALSRVYDRTDENARLRAEGKPLEMGLMTGWVDLDRLLQGVGAEFFVVAGRPSTGKTSFLLGLAKYAAMNQGKRVAIFSQEMTNDEIAERFLAMETGIDSQKIRGGMLEENEWPIYTHALETLAGSSIYVEDTSYMTPAKLKARCMKLASGGGLDLTIVDYIQLLENGVRKENRTQEVSYISRQLKLLSQELKIPVFAASQLSRAVESRQSQRPILSDLRESGSLEQDSNGVIMLYCPQDKTNITEAILEKRRNGAIGTVELVFRSTTTTFENAYKKR